MRLLISRFLLFAFILFVALPKLCSADTIKAFSLREANRLLAKGNVNNEELRTLGGITRLAGMVFDRENADIILVGKVRDDLPATTIDDLAVALCCRLLKEGYPRVSIDMDDDTPQTGTQDVRFEGGIESTEFGSDFFQSDVILKRYSLDLLKKVQGVDPYLKLYESATRKKMAEEGRPVNHVKWHSEQVSKSIVDKYVGKKTTESGTIQSRFWFHVKEDESFIVEQDDVYVIEELRLGVKTETVLNQGVNASGEKTEKGKDGSGEEFSQQFSDNYDLVCAENPLLKRLKVMFDLVCISEGVANLGGDRPDIDFLLSSYKVKNKVTPERYPLVHRIGEFRGNDNVSVLVQLSGGISLEAIMLALEDGDVEGLKMAVLNTRPDKQSLSWSLPLDEWKMPNDAPANDQNSDSPASRKIPLTKDLGFAVFAQEYIFDPTRPGNSNLTFEGFSAPPAISQLPVSRPELQRLDRLRTLKKGVSLDIDNEKLEKAILASDWAKVADLLDKVDVNTDLPALRYIKGHAYLALNRNNESLKLFYMMSPVDLQKWAEWGDGFLSRHKEESMAYFFIGDIYSRQGDSGQALEHFTKAVEIDKGNYLAWNASGVIAALQGDYGNSKEYFSKAIKIKPDFADALNNFGMMRIGQGQGRRGGIRRFTSVKETYKNFALAYHGLGCLELLQAQKLAPEDNENIQKALELLPEVLQLLIENESRFADAFLDKQADILFTDAGEKGTYLKKDFKIRGLADRANKIYNQRSQLPSKTSDFHKSMYQKRELKAHAAVAREYANMSTSERGQLNQVDRVTAGRTRNSLAILEKRYKSDLAAYDKGVNDLDTTLDIGSKFPPFKAVLSGIKQGTSRIADTGRIKMQQRVDHISQLRQSDMNDLSSTIKGEIAKGTYKPAHMPNRLVTPDQTRVGSTPIGAKKYYPGPGQRSTFNPSKGASTVISSKPYKPVGIPDQTRVGSTPTGGAKMSKVDVKWDDNEWPFMPIFGLLYFAPQTNSEMNGG
ncbi:MAG: hypothetical protein GY797_27020 [Deltaproteobacteria bacterium]|nr:hypothetical protein [Deltaproteobacteria bacterium]